MIDKVREGAITALLFVLLPIAFIVGMAWYVFQRLRGLEDDVIKEKVERRLLVLKEEEIRVDSIAEHRMLNYEQLRNRLLGDSPILRPSGGGTEGSDSDQGPDRDPGGDAA